MSKSDDKMDPKCEQPYVGPRLVVVGDITSLTAAGPPNWLPLGNPNPNPRAGGNPNNPVFS
jgi:hypothetical protein